MARLAKRSDLRRDLRRAAPIARVQRPLVTTISAPVGGLNARDDLSTMKETDAIRLDNWFPDFGRVTVRPGSATFATISGATGPVETLATLRTGGSEYLVAACDGKIYNVSAGGTISSSLGTGFANDRWQSASMSGVLGLVNGADAPQTFDGSSLAAMTVSGPTVANLAGINIFKSRSYFWDSSTASFWYSATNALGGTLSEFPLGDVVPSAGTLVAMATWTRDGGAGMDDLAVFLMSAGVAIVYQGSDPGSADDWSLIGVFNIGAPVADRAVIKLAGDVLIITSDGYVQLSKILGGVRGSFDTTISDKIVGAAQAIVKTERGNFGFEVFHYALKRMLIINHPDASSFHQHVANLSTGAWARFTGLEARCWALFGDAPYFGSAAGKIIQFDSGLTDDGSDVIAITKQAFSYLGSRSGNKQVTMLRPLLESSSDIPLTIGLAVDFSPTNRSTIDATLSVGAAVGAAWDEEFWDVASWGAAAQTVEAWLAHVARGYAISPSLQVAQSDSAISWAATTYSFVKGGVI